MNPQNAIYVCYNEAEAKQHSNLVLPHAYLEKHDVKSLERYVKIIKRATDVSKQTVNILKQNAKVM